MLLQHIEETTHFIKTKINVQPQVGIILGTGLGGLTKEIDIQLELPYEIIPHFPVSTVEGHSGRLIFGELGGKQVMAMQGRFHYYEGYSMQQVTFPVRVMKALGIDHLFVSNASGGVNPAFSIGDLMVITDHINFFPTNPLIGKNHEALGPRFPDMSEAYDKKMIALARTVAKEHQIKLQEGVYFGLTGPCFETPAEYRFIRIVGADTVGMSTVPEVIVARHGGMKVFAMSIITDLGIEGQVVKITHEEVQAAAAKAEPIMTLVMKEMIQKLVFDPVTVQQDA